MKTLVLRCVAALLLFAIPVGAGAAEAFSPDPFVGEWSALVARGSSAEGYLKIIVKKDGNVSFGIPSYQSMSDGLIVAANDDWSKKNGVVAKIYGHRDFRSYWCMPPSGASMTCSVYVGNDYRGKVQLTKGQQKAGAS